MLKLRSRPKAANILGMLSLAGLLWVWWMMANPLRSNGFLPRQSAVVILTLLAILSFVASLSGARMWLAVFAASLLTMIFVWFFYRPL
jgi:hypothetical protein